MRIQWPCLVVGATWQQFKVDIFNFTSLFEVYHVFCGGRKTSWEISISNSLIKREVSNPRIACMGTRFKYSQLVTRRKYA